MTDDTTLPRHLVLAQNLRGIGVYDPDDPPDRDFFTWLARKHQYRNVGFPTPLLDHPTVDIDDYQTFEPVAVPLADESTVREAAGGVPDWVTAALLVASAFVSPLFVHRPALSAFEPVTAWKCRSAAILPEDQVLRHARIAGYGMLDAFETETARGADALSEGTVDSAVRDRAAFARDDGEERFWRLSEEVSGDTWVGGYFDILCAVDDPDSIVDVLENQPAATVMFGLVGGIAVEPPYE